MDGYVIPPKLEDGKIKLNTIGTVIIGFTAFWLAMNAGLVQVADPVSAFAVAFLAPYAVDRISEKIMNKDGEAVIDEDIA